MLLRCAVSRAHPGISNSIVETSFHECFQNLIFTIFCEAKTVAIGSKIIFVPIQARLLILSSKRRSYIIKFCFVKIIISNDIQIVIFSKLQKLSSEFHSFKSPNIFNSINRFNYTLCIFLVHCPVFCKK